MINQKKVKRLGWVLGCSTCCQETWKQKRKNKSQPTYNRKIPQKNKNKLEILHIPWTRNG